MFIIAQDGSGDFDTIQAAIDALPEEPGRAPRILVVRMGEYRERVVVNKDNVRLVGETRDRTIIAHAAGAWDLASDGGERGALRSFTLLVAGRNVEVENLTVRNDAGEGAAVGAAVAAYAAGDRGVWRNCRMLSHQQPLYCGPVTPEVKAEIAPRSTDAECASAGDEGPVTRSRQYFEDCRIEGDTGLVAGPYRCWFERCTLYMGSRGGWYTAADTPEAQPWGLVFHACRLTGACPPGKGGLGMQWRGAPRALFLACDMDACVAPQGFMDAGEARRATPRCAEWGTVGPRAGEPPRYPAPTRLSDAEAQAVSIAGVIGGWDGWRPDRRTPTWFCCGDSTMADYPPERFPMTGWGQALQSLLPEDVFVENCAVCGRSSKSFVAEKRLGFIELCLRPGDKLLIQFSHNDEKSDPLIYTSPRLTFPEYLNMYIDAARAHGAEPVLITPIARRRFDANGQLKHTHGDYPAAMKALARWRGVRLVDMEAATMDLLRTLGDGASRALYCHVPPGHPHYPEGSADDSHLHQSGAMRFAAMFLEALTRPDAPR